MVNAECRVVNDKFLLGVLDMFFDKRQTKCAQSKI